MTDLLLQIGVSNLVCSLALGAVAWAVQATGKRPLIAHLLWLAVLVKLVTPPLLTVPMVAVPGLVVTELADTGRDPAAIAGGALPLDPAVAEPGVTSLWVDGATPSIEALKTGLALLWLAGSVSVLAWSVVRIHRFDRLLVAASGEAPPELQQLAAGLAARLGLTTVPRIQTTSAHLSPMVWWIGGRVRIFVPETMPREMGAGPLRWILAHELAHVRRRDHMVRWLEWLAGVAFWWNPAAWWARRNLRANEEVCCDALVLRTFEPGPHTYANSLLSAAEFLAAPALRPPAMASEIDSGGFLERRIRMIVSNQSIPAASRRLQALVVLCMVGLMPLGVAYAQDPDVKAVGVRLREAVRAGELTPEQARTMLAALRKQGEAKPQAGAKAPADEWVVLKKRLGDAVAAGELTREEAAKKLETLRKQAAAKAERPAAPSAPEPDWVVVKKRLGAAVEAGKLTQEEAVAKLEALRKQAAAKVERPAASAKPERDWSVLRQRLGAMVEAGKLTREEAVAKFQALRKQAAAKAERPAEPAPGLPAAVQRLRAAVQAGEMTREEAAKKLEALRRAAAAKDSKPGAGRGR